MSTMLDLSVFFEETFDINFPEIKENPDTKKTEVCYFVLQINKPTEETAIKILSHVALKTDDLKAVQFLSVTRDLTKSILNNNKNNKSFTDDWIKKYMPLDMQMAIVEGYTKYMVGLEKNPN